MNKKLLVAIILIPAIFLISGFVLVGKSKWEYKVGFLMPEAKAKLYDTAVQEWKELGVESEEFKNFCERFYPQGLSPGAELEAFKSFKEFELERIKKKGMPTFAEQEEFINGLEKDDWELIAVDTDGESGLPVGYFKRKRKSGEKKKDQAEPITPFDYPDRVD